MKPAILKALNAALREAQTDLKNVERRIKERARDKDCDKSDLSYTITKAADQLGYVDGLKKAIAIVDSVKP